MSILWPWVNRCVFDKEEKRGEVLKNVMAAFADGDHTLALIIKRTASDTQMYFAVKNYGVFRNSDSRSNGILLKAALEGNFPGSDVSGVLNMANKQKVLDITGYDSVSVLMNSPSEYSEDYMAQGLDKLLDGIVPKEGESYTVVFLAQSLPKDVVRAIIAGYEDLATAIQPFSGHQFQKGKSSTETEGEMSSVTNSSSIADSIFHTHSVNIGASTSTGQSAGTTVSQWVQRIRKARTGALPQGHLNRTHTHTSRTWCLICWSGWKR